jgi:hypothetical protein
MKPVSNRTPSVEVDTSRGRIRMPARRSRPAIPAIVPARPP